MFKTTLTAIALVTAVVNSSPSHAASSLFDQGLQDRGQWEQWFNSLQGDYKTGAFFWASQRSLPNPGSCKQMSDQFYAGCTDAKVKLSASDALRKTEPDYKTGWNAWDSSYVTAPTAPAVVVAPVPAPRPEVVAPSAASAAEPGAIGKSAPAPETSAAHQTTPAAAAPTPAPAPATSAPASATQQPVEKKKTTDEEIAELPDHTPKGVPLEKERFYIRYRAGLISDVKAWLEVTDAAVAMAHLDGLRCNTVSNFEPWTFSKGFTLQCNEYDYKYYLEDKGRGMQIRIAD